MVFESLAFVLLALAQLVIGPGRSHEAGDSGESDCRNSLMPRPSAPPTLGSLPTPKRIKTIASSTTAQSGWSPNGMLYLDVSMNGL